MNIKMLVFAVFWMFHVKHPAISGSWGGKAASAAAEMTKITVVGHQLRREDDTTLHKNRRNAVQCLKGAQGRCKTPKRAERLRNAQKNGAQDR